MVYGILDLYGNGGMGAGTDAFLAWDNAAGDRPNLPVTGTRMGEQKQGCIDLERISISR